jgi:hypothetical protein
MVARSELRRAAAMSVAVPVGPAAGLSAAIGGALAVGAAGVLGAAGGSGLTCVFAAATGLD